MVLVRYEHRVIKTLVIIIEDVQVKLHFEVKLQSIIFGYLCFLLVILIKACSQIE